VSRREERAGLLFAAGCALNGAFVPAVAKLTTQRGDALFVAAATIAFGGLCAAAVLLAQRRFSELFRAGDVVRLVAIGALGSALANLLYFEGAARTTAIEQVLCLQIEPAYALLAARVFLGHPFSARRILAVGALLAGIALALGPRGFEAGAGVALLLVTPLCWQVSHLIVLRGLVGVSPLVLTSARYVFGGAALLGVWWARGGETGVAEAGQLAAFLPVLALQGVVLSYFGTLLWYQAIARLDLARATSIVVPSIPLLSLGASFLILGEVATARQWAGLCLTALGVLAFVTAPHPVERRERIPTPTAPLAAPADDRP
jgi:drug/metabolite transporter (DMT)-like permease